MDLKLLYIKKNVMLQQDLYSVKKVTSAITTVNCKLAILKKAVIFEKELKKLNKKKRPIIKKLDQ